MSQNSPLVAITGASSFTGMWIAKKFKEQGWNVVGLLSRRLDEYSGLTRKRVDLLQQTVPVEFGIRVENDGYTRWVMENRPAIWIHHHHWMEDFRSPGYRYEKAIELGIKPLTQLIPALGQSECQGLIYTGTYFEPGEGGNQLKYPATPYAKSKRAVWEVLSGLCKQLGVPVSKFVMPNPVGAFENDDRLLPGLVRKAQAGEKISLRSPEAIADYLPIANISELYVELAEGLLRGEEKIFRPSGWVGSVRDWIERVNSGLIQGVLSLDPVEIEAPEAGEVRIEDAARPTAFVNSEPMRDKVDWASTWEEYGRWLKG